MKILPQKLQAELKLKDTRLAASRHSGFGTYASRSAYRSIHRNYPEAHPLA